MKLRIKTLLGCKTSETVTKEEPGPAMTAEPAIAFLAEVFGLTAFERDVLLLCAGVEMDSQLAAQCGTLKGRTQPGCATFDLALAALPDPHWTP